ncbi:UDP-N-acetylmuramoyl-L-alanine--D-glutamate ligase [Vitreoscilla stercoraria]|uniref:UDP-N-acetylmuramoylalanine--D-glutamate ligase n=1 Tax=Vitreoscilla stercoraria TaxID=61 RepID=A0ABY4EBN4_VITST|nr:UDP-N-acetylmuramoyl-L-alanine--D-glutamate ligase [Vitreoscilla stercoraria]UOO92758.1 UDP-N-acetylmuramoyl-L-alanine--D-glutamate ligase [Vitreoscilla stercoraria]
MSKPSWQNKHIVVAGLGSSGVSMLRFFQSQECTVQGYDAKLSAERRAEIAAQCPDIELVDGSLAQVLQDADILAVSPGFPSRQPEVQAFAARGGKVVGDVEIFAQLVAQTDAKVLAITGSNGKTTVTSLTGFLCEQSGLKTVVAGNIGLPVLDAWMQNQGQADVWVLELSSFQLDTTSSLQASAATVLNISEDHLDRYDDLLDYAHSKTHIFTGSGVQVLNADDALCLAMARPNREVKWFSLQKPSDYWVDVQDATLPLKAGEDMLLKAQDLALTGLHNAANALVALALCEAIGLPRAGLLPLLTQFKGLPHRVETIGFYQDVQFIDDSKGTNVGATCAALQGLQQPIVLIAGGLGKGQDFSPLQDALLHKARAVMLIGRDAAHIEAALQLDVPVVRCESLEAATQQGFALAQAGDAVLLSPACASMDMFRDYAHRSEVFIEAFKELSQA